jgi:hypothetical protein
VAGRTVTGVNGPGGDRRGFAGIYVIFDLPEVAVLERFVLRHAGIPVFDGGTFGDVARRGVVTTSDPTELRAVIRSRPAGRAAFIGTWSISETPLELRWIVLRSAPPAECRHGVPSKKPGDNWAAPTKRTPPVASSR